MGKKMSQEWHDLKKKVKKKIADDNWRVVNAYLWKDYSEFQCSCGRWCLGRVGKTTKCECGKEHLTLRKSQSFGRSEDETNTG